MGPNDFSDAELLQLFHGNADLSLLSPEEADRLDKLTAGGNAAATSGIPPAPHSDAHPLLDSDPEGYSQVDRTAAMLDPLANPKSMGDMAGLLIPSFAGVGSALTNAAAPIVKGAGQLVETAGQKLAPFVRRTTLPTALASGKAAIAAQMVPPALRGGGRILQRTGRMMEAAPLEDALINVNLNPARTGQVVEGAVRDGRFVPDGEFVEAATKAPTRDIVATGRATRQYQGASTRPPTSGLPPHTPAGLPEHPPDWEVLPMPSHGPVEAGPSPLSNRPGLPSPTGVTEMPPSGIPRLPPASNTFEMPASSLEGVNDYTAPAAAPRSLEDVAMSMVEDNPRQPLGMPRVLSWKNGAGPSAADVQRARDYGGVNNAASRLKVPQATIRELAPTSGAAGLPAEAQGRIRDAMQAMSPQEKQAYLAGAKNDLVRSYIQSLIGE